MRGIITLTISVLLFSCGSKEKKDETTASTVEDGIVNSEEFTFVFASCSDQDRPQPLWRPIIESEPSVFIWGGDNIYADTKDMEKMQKDYEKVWEHEDYQELAKNTKIIGTWDDHDYGLNDAGEEWEMKEEAKELFLEFIEAEPSDVRRTRPGVYYSEVFKAAEGSVKFILLDTRTFRTGLRKSPVESRRYDPWPLEEEGTILGEAQWTWLAQELNDRSTDFTFIVSSIQVLSEQHGWEKWGNHPAERNKLLDLIRQANSPNIIILSGDRHLAEYSSTKLEGMQYPIIDFTSSGLTHTFPDSPWGENRYRIMPGSNELNFGLIKVDFTNQKVTYQIRGLDNRVHSTLVQSY